jgi:hypothetical protein
VPVDVDEVVERLGIADVLCRYATALDTRDWPLLEQVFAAGATYEIGTYGEFFGPAAIADKLAQILSGYHSTQHLLGNMVSAVDGGTARSSSYVRAYHHWVDQDGRHTMEVGGVYRDQLVRTDEGWRIVRRVLDVIWREGVAHTAAVADDAVEARGPSSR